MRTVTAFLTIGLLVTSSAALAQPVLDGTVDAIYGSAVVTQDTNTGFGDNGDASVDLANGSELDAAFGGIDGGNLYLVLAGNLESNFNKLEIFFDTKPGGENRLLGGSSNQGGFLRMCDDGSGNGLIFETGCEVDYWVSLTGGGSPYKIFVDYVEIGGGPGYYLGEGAAVSVGGALSGGNAPSGGGSLGLCATIDNSNTAGVGGGGCPPGLSSGAGVVTGVELKIPLSAIGNPTGCIKVIAFVNGAGHDFISNQVLGPAADACNIGEPRTADFRQQPGTQSFQICGGLPTPTEKTSWGRVKTLYR